MVRIVVMALGVLLAVWLAFVLVGMFIAALKFLFFAGLVVAVIVGAFMLIGGVRRHT